MLKKNTMKNFGNSIACYGELLPFAGKKPGG